MIGRLSALCATAAVTLFAQTVTTLHTFSGPDGAFPIGALVQGLDGNLYGVAGAGGVNYGTVFKISSSGAFTTLYTFCATPVHNRCLDGESPQAGLVQAFNGELYGATPYGGSLSCLMGCGTVFKMAPNGAFTTLHRFCPPGGPCVDGELPYTGLVRSTAGDYYGATVFGGSNGMGELFQITPAGTPSTVYSFCGLSGCPINLSPIAALVQSPGGDLYGTTGAGGAYNLGAFFKMTPGSTPTILYSFCAQSGCPDGTIPNTLMQASDGNFYGTTNGGANSGAGTIFNVTPAGTFTTLYSFPCPLSNCNSVYLPQGLVEASDGNLYGTTMGATTGAGTIFKITPSGAFTMLYSFCAQSGCADGAAPYGGLVQATDGNFYGTTSTGGNSCVYAPSGCGAVFRLSAGLAPFVKPEPAEGKVGAVIEILGTKLTGASSVSFGGVAAAFKVVSSSLIAASVPSGAASGKIQVTTPGGTLSSNVPFHVLP